MVNPLLSVICRFHIIEGNSKELAKRMSQLDEALFSLSTQAYSNIQLVLVVQCEVEPNQQNKLLRDELEALIRKQPFQKTDSDIQHHVELVTVPTGRDGRTLLLNRGLEIACGQYLAFLDYDDVVYPLVYQLLIDRLRKNEALGCPIAVGGCQLAEQRWIENSNGISYFYTSAKRPYLSDEEVILKTKISLFANNFIPIHSYVLDRKQIDPTLLKFNSRLTHFEDYEFLLRLACRYEFDFTELKVPLVEYRIRNDGTNSIPTQGSSPEVALRWQQAQDEILLMKQTLVAQVPALELAKLIQERDKLLVERNLLSFKVAAVIVNVTNRFPKAKQNFFKTLRFIYKAFRKLRIFLFRSVRYKD